MTGAVEVPKREPGPLADALRKFMAKHKLNRGEVAQLLFDNHMPVDHSKSVALAYVHSHDVSYSWHHSTQRLITWDLYNSGRIWDGGYVDMLGGTDGLAHARNTAVRDFLAEHKAHWLLWVDSDAGFQPDTLDRLMETADPVERPIVSALSFAQRENDLDGTGGHLPVAWPVIMDWNGDGWAVRWDYPRDAVTKTDGVGSHCVLIHRSVFERMRDEYAKEQPGWMGWYSRIVRPSNGELVSEDLSFCARLMRLQIPVHVHTGVKTTHHKNVWLNEDDYWRARALEAMLKKAGHPHPYEPQTGEVADGPLVSVLIPYRAPRDSALAKVHQYTRELWRKIPGVEVIYADDGNDDGTPFNVAKALNRARAHAKGELLLTCPADALPPDADRIRWIRELLAQVPWAGVYDETHEFTESATEKILAGAAPVDHTEDVTAFDTCRGVVAVRAQVWDAIGGLDERFDRGWGWEDTAFRIALQAMHPDGVDAGQGIAYTLWHPPVGREGEAAHETIAREYLAAAESGRMRIYLASLKAVA